MPTHRPQFVRITISLGAMVLALFMVTPIGLADVSNASPAPAVSVTISAGAPSIERASDGEQVLAEGFGQLLIPGKPALPSRIFAIAIPPGAELIDVTCDAGSAVELSGTHNVAPAGLPRVVGDENHAIYAQELAVCEKNHATVYGSDAVYPASPVEFVRTAGYREYNLVDVRVTPYAYHPQSGRLVYYPNIEVQVTYQPADGARSTPLRSQSKAITAVAQEVVANYDEAQPWYADPVRDSRSTHDFVIITLPALENAVAPLVEWESQKGRSVEVVTTSWIEANYSGYDLAEKMRNFLREKYPAEEWGIEHVLLVGDYDDVPMRRTAQDLGYGMPETDYYYAELSYPDSSSWDDDGDHAYGEDNDSIDFYAEVSVGRIPYSVVSTVTSICEKSVAYEQNDDDSFKKNMLLLGAFFWENTDNAVMMEAKIDQTWMSDWTFTRMYEQNSTVYSSYACDMPLTHDNVMATWPTGTYAFVNWAGHGSPTSAHIMGLGSQAFIQASDCSSLSDDYPAIIFADACSNSDTDAANIGRAMLAHGGVGFLGATKVAYGAGNWRNLYSGSTQSMDYLFTTYVTSRNYTQGEAHQAALRYMYTHGYWYYDYYETFEWGALWGNPDLGMGVPPTLTMRFPDGLPELLAPGETTDITVQLVEAEESYVTGSGMLYYRYDGENMQSAPLVAQGGEYYTASLPAVSCGDTPEFYFVAEGDQGTVLTSPANAPENVYTLDVGVIVVALEDACEAVGGWTVGDVDDDATTGIWEHGDPEATLAQPEDDHSANGANCWVTGPLAGVNYGVYDVDDGKTTLFSPVYDVSEIDNPIISYWRWYSNETGGAPHRDEFFVDVSNDGGSTWVNAETVGPKGDETSGGWYYHEFQVSDFYETPAAVQVRFIAEDGGEASIVEALIDDFAISQLVCEEGDCTGDLDDSGSVDLTDLQTLLSNYGTSAGMACADGDMDGDGDIDLNDLQALLAAYGTTP